VTLQLFYRDILVVDELEQAVAVLTKVLSRGTPCGGGKTIGT
jgi:hypothetical protein